MSQTEGNKRAKEHSILSQSVQEQVLAPPMPNRPSENAGSICGQEATLDVSNFSITRQYVESCLCYREQALCIIVEDLSTFVYFQSMMQLAHVANSSHSRSEDIPLEMSLFQRLLEWKCEISFSQYSVVQKGFHDCFSIYCGAGR